MNQTPALISIILPNYNGERYLAKVIESFLCQDYEGKELIIVDGKSVDQSHSIIKGYADSNKCIKWVTEHDKNVTNAFNIGLAYATGKYVSFLTSDCVYFSNDIFKLIERKSRIVDFDVMYFDAYSHFVREKEIVYRNCNFPFTRDAFLLNGCFIPFENIFIRNHLYSNFRLNEEFNLSSDIEFYLRLIGKNPLSIHMPVASTLNIYDGNNLSAKFAEIQADQWIKVDIKSFVIDISEKEEILHRSIVKGNFQITKNYIREVEKWLVKLIKDNARANYYSDAVFKAKFIPYWHSLFQNSQKLALWNYFFFMKSELTSNIPMTKTAKFKLFCHALINQFKQ